MKKISLWFLKVFSAFCFAYVLALMAQEFLKYGSFSFLFVLFSLILAFLYLVKNYGFLFVLLVDAFLVFLALLLRFYVVMAYAS